MSYIALVVGVVGLWLAGKRNIGWLIGFVSTLFWWSYAIPSRQWAILLSSGIYGIIDLRNYVSGLKIAKELHKTTDL